MSFIYCFIYLFWNAFSAQNQNADTVERSADFSRRRTSGLTTVSTTDTQPDARDAVHTIWMNGPTYPSKASGGQWPNFGTGSTSSSSACTPTRSGYTGYVGDHAHSGYCGPASNDFNTDPHHLLIHSGRLGVVLDAQVSSSPIAKLGVVSEANADSSTAVYDALTDATLEITLDVTKTLYTDMTDPSSPNCASDWSGSNTPCPNSEYPECRGWVSGVSWGSCQGLQVTGSESQTGIDLGIDDNPSAQVQLVRQGHAVSHIIATRLIWNAPVEVCADEAQDPSPNCNQNFGGSSHPCGSEFWECRDFEQGRSWGTCWKPCIPGGIWAEIKLLETWIEATVWADSISLHLGWDLSGISSAFSGTVTSTLKIGGVSVASSAVDLSAGAAIISITESSGSIVEVTDQFPVTVTSPTGRVHTTGYPIDVYVEVPTNFPRCGYNNNCSPNAELVLSAENADSVERGLHLSISRNWPFRGTNSFSQSNTGAEITGLSAVLLDQDGYPTGIPIQISKNWHEGNSDAYWAGYDGYWWTMNIYAKVPALSTFTGTLRVFYQTYGSVPAFSHAQLSIVGYSDKWLWEEAAMYSGGESICFDPLGTHTRSFVTDVRPSLMDGRWKENVGGGDFLVYFDDEGKFVYPKRLDPQLHSNGPALTNATYRSISADEKIQSTIQISGGRTDDWVRVFMHIRYDILAETSFSRMAFYQFGADNYLYHGEFDKFIIGEGATVLHDYSRTCSGKDEYSGGPFRESLTGTGPWWISAAPNTDSVVLTDSEDMVVGDKGLIIRKYDATLGGQVQTSPAFSTLCDKIEINPPSEISTLLAGDYVELRIEILTLPRAGAEYDLAVTSSSEHGSATTLQMFSSSDPTWEKVQASAVGHISVTATSDARVESHYPVRVCANDGSDSVQFHVDGSTLGFVPIVICDLTKNYPGSIENYGLWMRVGTSGTWDKLDQSSQYATDYWQTNYVRETDSYEIIFNVEIFNSETYFSFGVQPDLAEEMSLEMTMSGVTEENKQAVGDSVADALGGVCTYVSLTEPSSSSRRRLTDQTVYMDIAVEDASNAVTTAQGGSFVSSLANMPAGATATSVGNVANNNDQETTLVDETTTIEDTTESPGDSSAAFLAVLPLFAFLSLIF